MTMPQKTGIINFPIRDMATLYASYMPFIQNGGLFVPSNRQSTMGEELFVLVTLPESSERIPLTGNVIWITMGGQTTRAPGFGIQLSGPEGLKFKNAVESILAGHLNAEHQTFTM